MWGEPFHSALGPHRLESSPHKETRLLGTVPWVLPASHRHLSPAALYCFCNPCPIFTVSMTQEPHEPDMGTPVYTAFIPTSQALQAAVIAGLAMAAPDLASQSSHSPCSWAEASPGKCHQVLPLLKTPRVPTAQRHPSHHIPASCGSPDTQALLPQPHGWLPRILILCNHFSSWACSFPLLVFPPTPSEDLQTPEPGACFLSSLPLPSYSLKDHYSILQSPAYTSF